MRIYLILLFIFTFQSQEIYGIYLVEGSSYNVGQAVEAANPDICQITLYRHEKILKRGNGVLISPKAVLTLTPNLDGYQEKFPYHLKVKAQNSEIAVEKIEIFADSTPTFVLLWLKDPIHVSRKDRLSVDLQEIPTNPMLLSYGPIHSVSLQKNLALWTRQNYRDYWNNIVLERAIKRRFIFNDDAHEFESRGPVLTIKSSSCGLEESDVGAPLLDNNNHLVGLALPPRQLIESDLYHNARTALEQSIIRNYSTLIFSTMGAALTVGLSVNQVDLITFIQAELISYVALEMLTKIVTYASQFTNLDEAVVSPYHFAHYLNEKQAEDTAILTALNSGHHFVNPFLRITPDVIRWIREKTDESD